MGEQYLTESKVWELYKRIEDVTKQQLDTGHPKIDDIVIENNGKKLIGKCGCSGLIYEWLNRNEVRA